MLLVGCAGAVYPEMTNIAADDTGGITARLRLGFAVASAGQASDDVIAKFSKSQSHGELQLVEMGFYSNPPSISPSPPSPTVRKMQPPVLGGLPPPRKGLQTPPGTPVTPPKSPKPNLRVPMPPRAISRLVPPTRPSVLPPRPVRRPPHVPATEPPPHPKGQTDQPPSPKTRPLPFNLSTPAIVASFQISGFDPETQEAADNLLESLAVALRRQMGPNIIYRVIGFRQKNAKPGISALATKEEALVIDVVVDVSSEDDIEAITRVTSNPAGLQDDLQGQGIIMYEVRIEMTDIKKKCISFLQDTRQSQLLSR